MRQRLDSALFSATAGGETAEDPRSLAALVGQLSEANDTAAAAKARSVLGRANVK